jgi:molybdopterin-guanine dinucleotide biosynthesis protein A
MHHAARPQDTTLGILAGGRASRLGGIDKAWLVRSGVPQVLRCHRALQSMTCATLVSANRSQRCYAAHGLPVVGDRGADSRGPVAGLESLALACSSDWLLTMPVDLVEFEPAVATGLMDGTAADGAFALDADGVQPLVALWRVTALRTALQPLAGRACAVQAVQAMLDMRGIAFGGTRFGNLNTPADLAAAGLEMPPLSPEP